jgi:glycerol-3-phosphate acyltransferase PlsY
MLVSILVILASYLWGGVPSAYLVARYLKGIDIREYGTGNVGASNLMEQVNRRVGLLLGAFDALGKGTAVIVAAKLMDQSLAVQVGSGLAAVAGHNWSPYLRFTGGRGVATLIGVMIGFLMWREILVGVVTIGIAGMLIMRESALWTLIILLALPALEYSFNRPGEFIYLYAGAAALLILKRLVANWEAPAGDYSLPRVLMYRLLWDRDVPRSAPWKARMPHLEEEG